ncbi:MAG TPA: cysteine peptidase family C39 domain-containing protein [Candidatus Saccharimonadaceae bacterium]|jgi:ABC-type bacteriocin/lantibiotic exporter with double-glycine peptidase domain|nr:cysteine peptidase family C39 domain-containing protein [Candidatus Saccharimonadaceae bacterium]
MWSVAVALVLVGPAAATAFHLVVPVVRQAPERCGPAALEMVLRYYGADSSVGLASAAYDPALRGALITDLAGAARRAGFDARVDALEDSALVAWLARGVPPIVLYQNGRPPLTVPHYAVVTGWEPERGCYVLNDGGARPRRIAARDLDGRWRTAGHQALIVTRRAP